MNKKKLGIVFLILISFSATGDIEALLDKGSTIIIARDEGVIAEKLISVNDSVNVGDEILILCESGNCKKITSPSDGILKEFSDFVEVGRQVKKGQVLAIFLNREVTGVLRQSSKVESFFSFEKDSVYCCLYFSEYEFNIYILEVTEVEHEKYVYFSVVNPSELVRIINLNGKTEVSFSLGLQK